MYYNLTDDQKELLKKLVSGSLNENWGKSFLDMSAASDFCLISLGENGHELKFDFESRYDMESIVHTGLILKNDNVYIITQNAFDAVKNDFIIPNSQTLQKITNYVGTQIQGNVTGGNIQGIAYVDDSTIQQIVNNPEKLAEELENITSDLFDNVKKELGGKQLLDYSKLIAELKSVLQHEKPDANLFKKIIQGLSFLNDTTSSVDLIVKTLPYISLILQLANQIFM